MGDLRKQIEWLQEKIIHDARICKEYSQEMNYSYFERVIDNTKKKYISDPNNKLMIDELNEIQFYLLLMGEDYKPIK